MIEDSSTRRIYLQDSLEKVAVLIRKISSLVRSTLFQCISNMLRFFIGLTIYIILTPTVQEVL